MGPSLLIFALMGEPAEPPAFRVDVVPPTSCKRQTTCEAKLRLVALNGYKVNEEYPFKFVGDAAPSLTFEGNGTFDKANRTMTVKFRADATGKVNVSGVFKLSVCTADVCKIEKAKISFAAPVS
jgi:hypothetical protein